MKILCIGNSFSQDATRYLHAIARADGERFEVANLYIGGCSLERHYRNMLSNERAYILNYNGQSTGFSVSLEEALLNREWTVITLQQASPLSFNPKTYEPYLQALVAHVRHCQPHAKLYLHQTWAYADGSERLSGVGYASADEMLCDIRKSYALAAESIRADGLIPSGELMARLLRSGIDRVHRDTFHASLGLGRYALALLWYRVLMEKDVCSNRFCDLDEEVAPVQIDVAKRCVEEIAREHRL